MRRKSDLFIITVISLVINFVFLCVNIIIIDHVELHVTQMRLLWLTCKLPHY